MVLVLMIYEYLSVMTGLLPANKDLGRRELELSEEDRRDRFADHMTNFEQLVSKLHLDPNDRATIDLIFHSYDQHGVSEQFYEDVRLALITNEQFKTAVKQSSFASILYPKFQQEDLVEVKVSDLVI